MAKSKKKQPGGEFEAPGITDEVPAPFQVVDVLVPLADPAPGFFPMEIEVELGRTERETLQRIAAGISAASKKHASGRAPNGAAAAVKYLLNLVAAAEPLRVETSGSEELQGG